MSADRDRRRFLADVARLSAGLSLGLAACRPPAPPPAPDASAPPTPSPQGPARALLPPQREALAAAVARILPTDQDPGAAEANVIEYLDRELAVPGNESIKTIILAGVVALNRQAQQAARKIFTALTGEEQDQIIGQVQLASPRGEDFIFILTVLTIEGFLGDPKYGGNRDGAGWRFIGYGPGSVDGSVTGHHHHYED